MDESFAQVVLPHLAAAYRLAYWLMKNEHDAEDAVQEASLRAFRYFRTFSGGNGRAWFFRIVRNTCHGWRENGRHAQADPFDEERHSSDRSARDPETLALQTDDVRLIEQAMREVPDRFRELLMRREMDGLSYRELADVMGMPIGSVMSGLSRGRQALRKALHDQLRSHDRPEARFVSTRDRRAHRGPDGPNQKSPVAQQVEEELAVGLSDAQRRPAASACGIFGKG